MNPSLGKRRRLQQAASPCGTFTILAVDHRGPLRRRLAKEPGIHDLDEAMSELKQDIVRELAPKCSAVLLDPELGLSACVESGALPGFTGLIVALDTGSTGDPAVLRTGLVPDWSASRIARIGAAGVKLLVYYHPDTPEAASVETLVHGVGVACRENEIPLYLEPLSYHPDDPSRGLDSRERRRVVMETARRLVPLGVDVLKAEFPGNPVEESDEELWSDACRELTATCAIPWVLLSAGVASEIFLRQAQIACEAGASGIMAGRAIWNEAVTSDVQGRRHILRREASDRLRQLKSLCDTVARPFMGRATRDPVLAKD